jgi:hypothetical protein
MLAQYQKSRRMSKGDQALARNENLHHGKRAVRFKQERFPNLRKETGFLLDIFLFSLIIAPYS